MVLLPPNKAIAQLVRIGEAISSSLSERLNDHDGETRGSKTA